MSQHGVGPRRSGQGLVEVVDVEDHRPIRGAVHTEVGKMSVTAELCADTRRRSRSEVCRHDVRRVAIEGERSCAHPAVSDRNQRLDCRLGPLLDDVDRVAPVRRGLSHTPAAERGETFLACFPRSRRSATLGCADGSRSNCRRPTFTPLDKAHPTVCAATPDRDLLPLVDRAGRFTIVDERLHRREQQ